MRKLSIIIPVLGRLEQQENTLISVLQNRPDDAEVLVVLNRPYDDPYDLGDEVRFIQARRRAGLVECLNLAIRESEAPILHLLACGVETTEDWTTSALRHFRDPQVSAVAPLILSSEQQRRIVAAGVAYSRGGAVRLLGQRRGESSLGPWTSQMIGPSFLAGFYRKTAIKAAGGFDASLGWVAAVDLALRLRDLGHRLLLDPQSKMYSPGELPGNARGFRQGLEAERLFLRHAPAGRWLGALAAHSFVAISESVRSLPRPACVTHLLGRAMAWVGYARQRGIQQQWCQALEAADAEPISLRSSAVPRPHIAVAPNREIREAA